MFLVYEKVRRRRVNGHFQSKKNDTFLEKGVQ